MVSITTIYISVHKALTLDLDKPQLVCITAITEV